MSAQRRPAPREASPRRPDARPGRSRARLSRLLPALALLFGALSLFTAAPASAQVVPPGVPQNVAVTVGDGKLTLTWQAPSSWGTWTASTYDAEWKLSSAAATAWHRVSSGSPPSFHIFQLATTTFVFTGQQGDSIGNLVSVTAGTAYDLRIRAISQEPGSDGNVDSHFRNSAWVTVSNKVPAQPKVPAFLGTDQCNSANIGLTRAIASNDYLLICDGQNWRYAATANATGRCTETLPLFRDRTLRYCGSGANNGEPIAGINAIGFVATSSPTPTCAAADFGDVHLRQADRSSRMYYCNGSTWVAVSLGTAPDLSPSFGEATVADQQYTAGTAIDALVLPAAEGGDGALTYTLATLPAGLTFTASTRTLAGTPTTAGTTTVTYTVTDADTSGADTDTLSFDIEVAQQTSLPAAPTNLSVNAGNAKLRLSWTASTGSPTGYDVHYTASTTVAAGAAVGTSVATQWVAATRSATDTTTVQLITGLTNNTPYRVRVRGKNAGGTSSWVEGTGTPNVLPQLTALRLVGGGSQISLSPTFAGTTTSYTAKVPHGTTSLRVTTGWTESGLDVTVGSADQNQDNIYTSREMNTISSSGGSVTVNLAPGNGVDTYVNVEANRQNTNESRTYIIVVTTLPPPRLTGLSLSAGGNAVTLSPSFASGTANYTATVPHGTTSASVTAAWSGTDLYASVASGTPNWATIITNNVSVLSSGGSGAFNLATTGETWVAVYAQPSLGDPFRYRIIITRAPPNTVTLSASPNPVPEGETVTVTATLSAPLASTVTIPVAVTDGTAESNDHGPLTSITIPAGATKSSQGITTSHDPDDENETFTVALGTLPSGLGLVAGSPSSVEITISDDEGIPTVNLSASPDPAVEGASVALEACLRKGDVSAKPDGTLRIPVRLSHGTSEDGDWGKSLSGHRDGRRPIRTLEHITINSQSSCGLVNIPIHRDSDTDNETFTAALVTDSLPASVVAGTASVTVNITDSANAVERPRPTGDWSPTTCTQAGVQSGVVGRTTMTAGRGTTGSITVNGYNPSAQAYSPIGTLTSKEFSHDGTVYEMRQVTYTLNTQTPSGNDILGLKLDRPHTASLRAAAALHAGNKVFHFGDADQPNGSTLRWSNAGLSWSEGQQVELCVTVARVSLSVSPAPVPEGGTATVTATLSRTVPVGVIIPVTVGDIAGQSGPDWAKSLVDDGIPIGAGQKSGSVALAVGTVGRSDATYRVILDYENLPDTVQSGSPSAVSINVRDRANADRPQGQDPCPGCARTVLGIAVDPALVAQVYEWRNDPQWASYKSHTDRWDRVLLAFGETVADASLTAMTAAEAQAFADQPWGTRWVEVAKTLKALEAALAERTQPLGQPPGDGSPQQASPHAALIAQMVEWRNDPQWRSYKSHTDRWGVTVKCCVWPS